MTVPLHYVWHLYLRLYQSLDMVSHYVRRRRSKKWYDKAGEEDQQEAAEEVSTQSIEDVK